MDLDTQVRVVYQQRGQGQKTEAMTIRQLKSLEQSGARILSAHPVGSKLAGRQIKDKKSPMPTPKPGARYSALEGEQVRDLPAKTGMKPKIVLKPQPYPTTTAPQMKERVERQRKQAQLITRPFGRTTITPETTMSKYTERVWESTPKSSKYISEVARQTSPLVSGVKVFSPSKFLGPKPTRERVAAGVQTIASFSPNLFSKVPWQVRSTAGMIGGTIGASKTFAAAKEGDVSARVGLGLSGLAVLGGAADLFSNVRYVHQPKKTVYKEVVHKPSKEVYGKSITQIGKKKYPTVYRMKYKARSGKYEGLKESIGIGEAFTKVDDEFVPSVIMSKSTGTTGKVRSSVGMASVVSKSKKGIFKSKLEGVKTLATDFDEGLSRSWAASFTKKKRGVVTGLTKTVGGISPGGYSLKSSFKGASGVAESIHKNIVQMAKPASKVSPIFGPTVSPKIEIKPKPEKKTTVKITERVSLTKPKQKAEQSFIVLGKQDQALTPATIVVADPKPPVKTSSKPQAGPHYEKSPLKGRLGQIMRSKMITQEQEREVVRQITRTSFSDPSPIEPASGWSSLPSPKIPKIDLELGRRRSSWSRRSFTPKTRYAPSLLAVIRGVTSVKQPKTITGFGIRPIVKGKKKKRGLFNLGM